MIDVVALLQDDLVRDIPIIYVLNVVTAIENQLEDTRTIIDKNQIKEERISHV